MADLIEITLPDGTTRRLGNNPQPGNLTKAFPVYGDTTDAPMIPRDQWKPTDLSKFCSAVKDQNGIGACNAFDSVYVLEGCRRMQGLPDVTLSPGYLYGLINGGRDEGSALEDAMHQLMTGGTCKVSTVGALDWRHRPAAAKTEAMNYRILELYVCPTFDHMASAIQCGFIVSSGLLWYNNFTPDVSGWLPSAGRGQAGGHAVARFSLDSRNGVWGLGGPNSWTTQWGLNGFMTIPETLYNEQIGGFWACRSAVDEGGVVPIP